MLVTTRLKKRCADCSRAACEAIVGGAKSARPVRISAPTACPEPFRSPIVLADQMQALGRVVAPDRQRRHHRRDPVAQRPVLLVGADADRDHRPQLELVGVEAARPQVAAKGAGHGREDDVVDGSAELVLDPLELVEVGGHVGEAAVRPDLDVERGARRREPGADQLAGRGRRPRAAARRCAAGRAARRARRERSRAGLVARSSSASASSLAQLGSGRGSHSGPSGGWAGRLGGGVEEDAGYVNPRDPVDEGVVGLADDREAVAVEALGEPHLPERLGAVELLGEDPRRKVSQLLLGARGREGGAPHVVLEVQMRVVDPDRPALAEGHEAKLLAKARHQVQSRVDVVAELLVRGGRALEDRRRGDVHVGAVALQVKERRVQSAEPVLSH